MLGNEAGSARPLLAWRNRLMDDLTAFVNRELRGEVDEGVPLVQRTGTESFTSDLDISLLGPNAAANRQAALSFLACSARRRASLRSSSARRFASAWRRSSS